MSIIFTMPMQASLRAESPVGSADPARNSDYRFLDVGLPAEVARLKSIGRIDEARAACLSLLDGDPTPELAACLRAEHHRMGRMRRQFCVSRASALEQIRAEWPEFTEGQLDDLVDRGRIDWRCIDGEQRFLDNFLDSLRVYPAEVPGLKPDEPTDTAARDAMLHAMHDRGRAAYDITLRARISVLGALPGERVRAWLPIPASAPQQSQIVGHHRTPGAVIARAEAPARTLFWESTVERTFETSHTYRSQVPYVDTTEPAPAPSPVSASAPCEDDLAEVRPHIRFSPYLRELTAGLVEGLDRPIDRARAIYDYLTGHVDYRYQPDYAQLDDIADSCAKSLRGDCGVMALTFITMCRIAGIPARWQSGLYVAPDFIGPHDWAMFYTPDFGWLWADVSFGSSARRTGDEFRRLHYFGNLDPWRMVANSVYQADFEPTFDEVRWDPYDNQMGEASVEGRGCDSVEMIREVELIEMHEV